MFLAMADNTQIQCALLINYVALFAPGFVTELICILLPLINTVY